MGGTATGLASPLPFDFYFSRRDAVEDTNDSANLDAGQLPERGEYVDSIGYYGRELDAMNDRVAGMQHEKLVLARTGNDSARASQWISHAIDRVSTAAESTLVSVCRSAR